MTKLLYPVSTSTELFQYWMNNLSSLQINEINTLFKWDYKDGSPDQFAEFVHKKYLEAVDQGWTASIKRKTSEMTGPQHEIFDYLETPAHKVEFYDMVELYLDDWFTKPIKDWRPTTDDEKINYIDGFRDVYMSEVDYRYEDTDQQCLYDLDHVVCFDIKNTPDNLRLLTEDPSYIYAFHHADEEDWDFLEKSIIRVEILNEWDWIFLNREAYSQRFITGFCSYYAISNDDVLDRLVFVNG